MTKKSSSIASAMLIALSLSTAQAAGGRGANLEVPQEARETLKDIETSALQAETQADQLRTIITNQNLSWESHLSELNALKQEVNSMGKEMASLENERESLAPWEQQAVDKVLPLLKDTATNTTNAILYLNDNKVHLWSSPDYRAEADRIRQDSEQISKTLKDYLKFSKASNQERQLRGSLGVTGE